MLVPKLWALPAEMQTDVVASTLCCAMVRILEIVTRAENSATLYTWD